MIKKLLLFLVPIYLFALPNWFYNIKVSRPNYYVGYGVGDSKKEAKLNALKEIASKIDTKINSDFHIRKTSSASNYSKTISQNIEQKVKANISDYEVLQFAIEDKYYIAIGYENIPNIDKFIKKLKKLKKVKLTKKLKNKFLQKTYFAKILKEEFGFFVDFKIYFKDDYWYISSHNIAQKLNKEDIKKLYISVDNNIQIKLNKTIFYDEDEIKVKVKPTYDGYVTLLDITSTGAVYILVKNRKVTQNKWTNLQSQEFDFIASSGDKNSDFELYVAILSKKKQLFDEFYTLVSAEENKDMGNLIKLLQEYDFATMKIITKSRE